MWNIPNPTQLYGTTTNDMTDPRQVEAYLARSQYFTMKHSINTYFWENIRLYYSTIQCTFTKLIQTTL